MDIVLAPSPEAQRSFAAVHAVCAANGEARKRGEKALMDEVLAYFPIDNVSAETRADHEQIRAAFEGFVRPRNGLFNGMVMGNLTPLTPEESEAAAYWVTARTALGFFQPQILSQLGPHVSKAVAAQRHLVVIVRDRHPDKTAPHA